MALVWPNPVFLLPNTNLDGPEIYRTLTESEYWDYVRKAQTDIPRGIRILAIEFLKQVSGLSIDDHFRFRNRVTAVAEHFWGSWARKIKGEVPTRRELDLLYFRINVFERKLTPNAVSEALSTPHTHALTLQALANRAQEQSATGPWSTFKDFRLIVQETIHDALIYKWGLASDAYSTKVFRDDYNNSDFWGYPRQDWR